MKKYNFENFPTKTLLIVDFRWSSNLNKKYKGINNHGSLLALLMLVLIVVIF